MSDPVTDLGKAARLMRAQHGPEHPRHWFWSALADWLDRFADPIYCYGAREFDHALAIARAYLGMDDG